MVKAQRSMSFFMPYFLPYMPNIVVVGIGSVSFSAVGRIIFAPLFGGSLLR